jgi:hypothetical protein
VVDLHGDGAKAMNITYADTMMILLCFSFAMIGCLDIINSYLRKEPLYRIVGAIYLTAGAALFILYYWLKGRVH